MNPTEFSSPRGQHNNTGTEEGDKPTPTGHGGGGADHPGGGGVQVSEDGAKWAWCEGQEHTPAGILSAKAPQLDHSKEEEEGDFEGTDCAPPGENANLLRFKARKISLRGFLR